MSLRFHWMLPKGGEVGMKTAQETSRVLTTKSTSKASLPDMEGWLKFSRCAEEAGIEAVLMSFSRYEPDTLVIASALGQVTKKLKFIVAYRTGFHAASHVRAAGQYALRSDRRACGSEYRGRQFGGRAERLWRLPGPRRALCACGRVSRDLSLVLASGMAKSRSRATISRLNRDRYRRRL